MSPVSDIGTRIAILRRDKGYTQEQLAQALGISGQAVSKWETGKGLPDTALLPALAGILEISIDRLLTGSEQTAASPYDKEYEKKEYYWGEQPSFLALQVIALHKPAEAGQKRLLDIGSGEGRDAVFFSSRGYRVDALEISAPGIRKIKELSARAGLKVNAIQANMIGYQLPAQYDIIYSMGSLQFLPPAERTVHFDSYKKHTVTGGLNAHMVFVEKPFIPTAPDWEKNEYFYRSGDLAACYHDWEILFNGEAIFDCRSADIPHQHAVSYIVARKTD